MKKLIILYLLLLVTVTAAMAQTKVVNLYDTARFYYFKKDFEKAFLNYDRHYSDSTRGKSNYDSYYAAVAACQTGRTEKAVYYLRYAFRAGFYPSQYNEIALDPLNSCLKNLSIWKPYMAALKLRKDSLDRILNPIRVDLNNHTLQASGSMLNEATRWRDLTVAQLENKIKTFSGFKQPAKSGFWTLYYLKSDTLSVPYLLYIPKNYKASQKTPLYIFLHGAVSNKKAFVVDPANTVDEQRILLKRAMEQNAFIIWPYAKNNFNWLQHQKTFDTILKEIATVKSSYNIDDNKVYLGGHSDGGAGAFWFALNNPTAFAATFAMNYFPRLSTGNTHLRNLQNNRPFVGISGISDTGMPLKYISPIHDYTQKHGGNWINYELNGSHTLPYDKPDSIYFLFDTLISMNRDPFPRKVTWETDAVANGRNSWVAITELDTNAKQATWHTTLNPEIIQNGKVGHIDFNKNKSGAIMATANGNDISIETSRVKRIKLYLSADMFDFKKQLQITVNGESYINIKPERDKVAMLQEFLKTGDRQFVVSSVIEFTVDDKKH